jgi:hypothetical protein
VTRASRKAIDLISFNAISHKLLETEIMLKNSAYAPPGEPPALLEAERMSLIALSMNFLTFGTLLYFQCVLEIS